jgi:hypothetical protein
VYCKTCVFFSPNDGVGKGGNQNPGKLLLEKFYNWKKVLGDKGYFKLHSNSIIIKHFNIVMTIFWQSNRKMLIQLIFKLTLCLKKKLKPTN